MEPALAALAYIDPGSGSLAIQALIAAIVAVPFFFRRRISRGLRALRRGRAATEPGTRPDERSSR